jgi:hypothetical protein
MSDWSHEYYSQSRGYNWVDMTAMRSQPRDVITEVPDVFKDKFDNVDDYIEWLDQKRADYFG